MFKSTSTSLILLGILAVIVGIVAIAWRSAAILALVILFAVYAFMDAGLQPARAFSGRTAGPSASCCSPAPTWARSHSRCCSACTVPSEASGSGTLFARTHGSQVTLRQG